MAEPHIDRRQIAAQADRKENVSGERNNTLNREVVVPVVPEVVGVPKPAALD